MVTAAAIVFRSCCVAVGYSDCSVSVKAVSTYHSSNALPLSVA